jgi:hypothetical protein
MLIDAVSGHPPISDREINNFLVKQFDWSKREARARVLHALTIVKASAVPYVYARSKNLVESVLLNENRSELKQ